MQLNGRPNVVREDPPKAEEEEVVDGIASSIAPAKLDFRPRLILPLQKAAYPKLGTRTPSHSILCLAPNPHLSRYEVAALI